MECTYISDSGQGLRDELASTASLESINGIFLLSTLSDDVLSDAFDTALQALDVPVFGGVFPELLYGRRKETSGAVVVGLSHEPVVTTVSGLSESPNEFRASLDAELPNKGYETAFVFVDGYASEIESFIEALFRTYSVGLNFIGGGAGTLDMDQQPCLFTNEGVIQDAAVVATVQPPIKIGVKHGWQEIAGPFRVTDAVGSTLGTLDGKPAFSVYCDIIEAHSETTVTQENFFEVAKSYPFGISRMDAEQIVRDPFTLNDDGSIMCFGDIPEGEFVNILRGEPQSLINAAQTAYEDARSSEIATESLFFFDCISRVLYLESEFDRELAAVTKDVLPVVGALTLGEIANDGAGHLDYYNKTAVVGATETL